MVNGISQALLCPQAAFEVHLISHFYVTFTTVWAHFIARLQLRSLQISQLCYEIYSPQRWTLDKAVKGF